jgi:hypothetical protein
MASVWNRVMATYDFWQRFDESRALNAAEQNDRYSLLGSMYAGTWANDSRWRRSPALYRNTRQIVKDTQAIVDCYEQLVYAGVLPVPGKDLPEGTQTAIPIEPQTGSKRTDDALLSAFYTLFDLWKWQQRMALIPKTAAIYGDVLVLLVDEFQRGVVVPEIINPWNVPADGLELDSSDNVKALAIEYDITIAESKAFGRDVKADHYRYRKEITPQDFRYYKNDRPFDYDGRGEVQPNPYGFVPACWFRHELVAESDRGRGAFEGTLVQSMEMNSLLSGAFDYQQKQFGAPIGIKGSPSVRPGHTTRLPGGVTITAGTTSTAIDEARREEAETVHMVPMSDNGEFVTINFDIGKTTELLERLDGALVRENPESKYAQLIAEIANPTGPGVRMTLRPIISKVQAAQGNHDPQMVKLCQMATTMMGMRLNNGDIPREIVAARPDRYKVFAPYTLESFGRGLMDASIAPRDPFPESKLEQATWLAIAADLPPWAQRQLGIDEADIAAQEAANKAQAAAQLAAFSVAGAGNVAAANADQGQTGPTGPTGVTGVTGG